MNTVGSDLTKRLAEVLQTEDSKQELSKLIRKSVFGIEGIVISFDERNDVKVHFTPTFFGLDTFRKGRYLDSPNVSKIIRFHGIMRRLAAEAIGREKCVMWTVDTIHKPTPTDLNTGMTFNLNSILGRRLDEVPMQELLNKLKSMWAEIRLSLQDYGYDF